MDYFRQLFTRAWLDTWDAVFNGPLSYVLCAISIFGLTLLFYWIWKGYTEMKDVLMGGIAFTAATIIVFGGVFVFHVLVLSPKHLFEEEHAKVIALREQTDGRAHRRMIQDKLGIALSEGQRWLNICATPNQKEIPTHD